MWNDETRFIDFIFSVKQNIEINWPWAITRILDTIELLLDAFDFFEKCGRAKLRGDLCRPI